MIFRRHRHPRPLRRNDRRWLERIAAGNGMEVGELPASVAARLADKGAIATAGARWVITGQGRKKLGEEG